MELVKQKRVEKGFSQEDIAFFLNMSRGFIGQIESPYHPSKYNLNHINILAREMNCSPRELLPEEFI